ncbi:unnamed protein product [Schistosoma margrebowiei]|uniref:Uncharacterized protein n=1 Tax=Schistosoma margrebowiei TaxID=48269 RepID=A0A183MN83_9TREM|nr:unnamed protein product [Schistosoma margrebowiei]
MPLLTTRATINLVKQHLQSDLTQSNSKQSIVLSIPVSRLLCELEMLWIPSSWVITLGITLLTIIFGKLIRFDIQTSLNIFFTVIFTLQAVVYIAMIILNYYDYFDVSHSHYFWIRNAINNHLYDLDPPSHTRQQMTKKMTSVAAAALTTVGLNIHKRKSEILRYNTTHTNRITIDGEALEDVKTFYISGQHH